MSKGKQSQSKLQVQKMTNKHDSTDEVIPALKKPPFAFEINKFVMEVESLSKAYKQTERVVESAFEKTSDDFMQYLKDKGVSVEVKSGKKKYKLKPEALPSFLRSSKDLLSSALSVQKVPQIFFCSLVHQYDSYLGKLLRVAFLVKPDILNASEKQLTFADLSSFASIEDAREYLIEKEIETVIRDSHDGHFNWMEKRFRLPLRKELLSWSKFIEMTERRHLFVHCDGIVSSQYLNVCKKHGVQFEKELKPAMHLGVSNKYFDNAVDCFLEIGIKLGHVLWRKLQPDNIEEADNSLHATTFDFLSDEKYALAKILLQFAVNTLKKHSSDNIRRIHLINLAIAHYKLGEKQEALNLLNSQDWSACTYKFKLAVAVLQDKYEDAAKLMIKIGKKGEVSREDYSSWPLFIDFRKSEEFLKTYRKLFGKDFIVTAVETDRPKV